MPPQNGVVVDLKSLLSNWKLECILSHLLAEKIDIEVFEMMKLYHIRQLLRSFPLGVQIRFEYYLEQWREDIGKPLQLAVNDDDVKSLLKDRQMKTEMDNKSTQTDLIIHNVNSSAAQANNANSKEVAVAVACAEDHIIKEETPKQLTTELSTASKPPPPPPPPIDEVDLLAILQNASCGIRLLTSYGMRQSFTDKERKLLIETIVDHYIDNKMKFNVQISYALERSILKLFPSEKLKSYRTAKLGRIYITYANFRAKEKAKHEHKKSDESLTNDTNQDTNNKILINENLKEIFQISGDHVLIRTNSTDEIDMGDASQVNAVNDGSVMSDITDSMVVTIENSDEDDENEENKSNTDVVDLTAALDSGVLIGKMLSHKRQRMEAIDGPFINFTIPWQKVPHDLMTLLENGQQLGRHLNIFTNLVVDELRKVSTKVPMRVLRAVSQQAIIKYPNTFLDKDAQGNLKPSASSALLSRLRNRNTFLNRQDR